MAHKSDQEIIRTTHNTARFFIQNRHIAWVLLIATALWGAFAYFSMPQRKDPEIPVRQAVAMVSWPGESAERVEQLITTRMEEQIAANRNVTKIESISRTGLAVTYVELGEDTKDTQKEFDDIDFRLNSIHDLPKEASPIRFIKDFGDTSALMLTVASPKVSGPELQLRIRDTRAQIEHARSERKSTNGMNVVSVVQHFPRNLDPELVRAPFRLFQQQAMQSAVFKDFHFYSGSGFAGTDFLTSLTPDQVAAAVTRFKAEYLHAAEFHPDAWPTLVIGNLSELESKMTAAAGDKYSYRELEDITETMQKTLQAVPIVSKVERSGILPERVLLTFSQERLATYDLPTNVDQLLGARNTNAAGGEMIIDGRRINIEPSGEFHNEKELGDLVVTTSRSGTPVYLRDLVDITREYQTPSQFLNFYSSRDAHGQWHRNRAITLAVQMRSGEQIGHFGENVDKALEDLRTRMPADLVISRTSDQPLQVHEQIHLFMNSLVEAVILVVVISWIGFWEWRSALVMALSIPLTLAMTFGMMHAVGIDIQQVSIASLIIALGLLVDDPVVAGDAIKRSLAAGHSSLNAAWLGPTKLATAIVFATLTNIVAYLPFMWLTGDPGKFLYSLAIVLTCSLVASRLVSMTFIPLLGYYLLRPKDEPSMAERRKKGFAAIYYKIGDWAIAHRWKVMAGSGVFLLLGGVLASQLKTQFFPKDYSYLSYVDVWLPNDAPLAESNQAAAKAEAIMRRVAEEYSKEETAKLGKPHEGLKSLTTFVGGGGPRFWFSVSPELQQLNYAQIIIQVNDKHDTTPLVERFQAALSAEVPGARIDVRQLETAGVGIPIAVRISGEDIHTLRAEAEKLKQILRDQPLSRRVRDDWGADSVNLLLQANNDRANLAGITNSDIAQSSSAATSGRRMTTLRDGDKQIPVVAKMRIQERAQLSDLQNLYIGSSQGRQKVQIGEVASIQQEMRPEKLGRRQQFRTITVQAFPAEGHLPSELLTAVMPKIKQLEKSLPLGYHLEIGGEFHEQQKGFKNLAKVMLISISAIFLALVFQFRHAFKPLIVFAAIPYGMMGALFMLWLTNTPFGFMGFLGIASLIGVIVSHVIVLFDFIEEAHERGESLREALLDAGIVRLRPVLITVGATVIALFPLAAHGGPLWEPLCYAQIGGLCVATVITLLLVPVLYAIFVLDLKWVKWGNPPAEEHAAAQAAVHTIAEARSA